MSKRTGVWLVVCAVAVIGLALFGSLSEREASRAPVANSEATRSEAPIADRTSPQQVVPEATPFGASATAAPEPESTVPPPDASKVFQVDSAGKLVLDEQTRLNVEALFARTDRSGLTQARQQAVDGLPPAAAAQAADLLERYDNYQQAQRQAYPPGAAPPTEEAALAELDGLHALRVAHFGAAAAHALYGAEETVTRQLIELMRLEKDQSLTMEEKAERAQQMLDSMPELAEIQRRTRDVDAPDMTDSTDPEPPR